MANKLKNTQKKSIARELYLHGDFTFEEIAAKVDAARQTISRWELGMCYPDIELLPSIANYFGVTVDIFHLHGIVEDLAACGEIRTG